MPSLGFYNHASTQTFATHETVKNIRSIYPDAPIFISLDGDSPIAPRLNYWRDEYKVQSAINVNKLGYPPYDKKTVLEWLCRMYVGVFQLNTTHFMMVEDDCRLLNEIKIEDDWECVGHVITHGNKIHPFILSEIERISKVKPNVDYYGNGGGSIFKTKTFLNNFQRVYDYFTTWWSLYELYFMPPAGYMDCYMTLYYLLCGKHYTPNPKMKNLDPHDPYENNLSRNANEEEIYEMFKDEYDLVHNWKLYYE